MITDKMIIEAIIILLFAVITRYIIPLIKSKTDAGKMAKIEELTAWAVRYAEQLFTDNPTKKNYVLKYITEKVAEMGLKLTVQDISNLVEYTVNLIKYGSTYTRNNSDDD